MFTASPPPQEVGRKGGCRPARPGGEEIWCQGGRKYGAWWGGNMVPGVEEIWCVVRRKYGACWGGNMVCGREEIWCVVERK